MRANCPKCRSGDLLTVAPVMGLVKAEWWRFWDGPVRLERRGAAVRCFGCGYNFVWTVDSVYEAGSSGSEPPKEEPEKAERKRMQYDLDARWDGKRR